MYTVHPLHRGMMENEIPGAAHAVTDASMLK